MDGSQSVATEKGESIGLIECVVELSQFSNGGNEGFINYPALMHSGKIPKVYSKNEFNGLWLKFV